MKNVSLFKEMLVLATLSVFGAGCPAGQGTIENPSGCIAQVPSVSLDSPQITSYQAGLQKLSYSLDIYNTGAICNLPALDSDFEILIFDQAVVLGAYDDNDALDIVSVQLGQVVDGLISFSGSINHPIVAGTTYYIVFRGIDGMSEVMTTYLIPGVVELEDDPELVFDVL